MNNKVDYPPKNVGEYSEIHQVVFGIVPIRMVVVQRIDGWCVYCLQKYMTMEFCLVYDYSPNDPTPWNIVRSNGSKLLEEHAKNLFPDMEGNYAR